ncbi:MAG: glycosyltransferase family 2 protein [Deltaproteobacteria bacterium]
MGGDTTPAVAVVVLDWDGGEESLAALASVAETAPAARLIFVDNASRVPVLAEVRARFPAALVIENTNNLGYAGGNNAGLAAARAAGCTRALVLNNDATLEPGALDVLLGVAAANPHVAIVGARILDARAPTTLAMAWGEVNWRQSLVGLPGRGGPDGPRWAVERDVDWVSGCALLLCLDRLDEVGLFDETFFAYHEEVDLCARARKAGLRVVYAGAARVRHRGEGSSGGGYVSRKQYFVGRNMVRFVRRHADLRQALQFWMFFLGTIPLQWLRRLASGESHGVVLKMRGAWDTLAGRPLPRRMLDLDHRREDGS